LKNRKSSILTCLFSQRNHEKRSQNQTEQFQQVIDVKNAEENLMENNLIFGEPHQLVQNQQQILQTGQIETQILNLNPTLNLKPSINFQVEEEEEEDD
jgi:hypothetical protein